MLRSELKAIGDVIVKVVRTHVRNAVDTLSPRLAALEARPPAPAGRDGRDGAPGAKGEPGANGRDGVNGVDGLGFDDISLDFDGERNLVLRFRKGDNEKAFPLRGPWPIDRGIWRATHPYQRGDSVSHGGSTWTAQKDDPAGKPGEVEGEWRLAVKKGRDGKDGERGAPGAPGERGLPGLNKRRIQ